MRKFRKTSLLICTLLLTLSLAACGSKTKRNTSVPYGSLDLSAVVAKSGDYKVTNDIYYNKLRADGYSTVLNKIQSALVAEELEYVKTQINLTDNNVTDYEKDLFKSYAAEVLGTNNVKTLNKMDEKDINVSIEKFIDSCNNKGFIVTKEDCLKYKVVDDEIRFTYVPNEILEEKMLNFAINEASKRALEKIVDEEKIKNDEDKLVTNTNYISEENVKSYYENNTINYGTYCAIVVQFNNLNEARNVINAVTNRVGELTDDNALRFYVELYNTYYNYRPMLNIANPWNNQNNASKTEFVVNKDKDELSEISSSIKNIVTTTLDEDGQYITKPFNQNNKYIMVYRGATEFYVTKTYNIFDKLSEKTEWNDLKEHTEAYNTIYSEIKKELVKNKISTYSSTLIEERLKNTSIEIYDPLFEFNFKKSNDDYYELIEPSKFDKNNIFKLTYKNPDNNTETVTTYSVADFYKEQTKKAGLGIIVNQLYLEYVYQYKDRFVTDKDITNYEKEVNDNINSFKKNENSAYPQELGEELYLLASYGYTTKDNVLKYARVAQNVLTKYLNEKVYDEWAVKNEDGTYPETHEIDYSKLNALDNILNAGNDNYSSLFSINIDHMLIFIDDDGDGSPDDPKEFVKDFNETQMREYNDALLALAQAIYAESKCEKLTESNSTMEILQYIVGAYSRNEELYSKDDGTTWAEYKKYNFLLKPESLSSSGSTTQSNVDNYVKEFGDYVKELYNVAVKNNLDVDDKDYKAGFYFINSRGNSPIQIEDLCATEFGYHMIIINDYDSPDTTKNLATNDTNGYQKNIEVLLNEKEIDTTDDNIYVIVPDIYNEDANKATINQLFTYYVQQQKGVTSSFDTSLRSVLSSMFSDAISRFTSTEFQTFLLYSNLNIEIVDSTVKLLDSSLNNYKDYLIRKSQDYDVEDKFTTWYDGSLNWARPY